MKRFLVYFASLFLLTAIIIATFYAKDAYKVLPINTTLNKTPLPLNESWFEYEAPNGHFKVSFPLLPQTATQKLPDPSSEEPRQYEMYVTQTDKGTIYMVSLIILPNQPNEKDQFILMDELMHDMVKANLGNKLKSNSTGSYKGFPSIDFIIENDQNTIHAKEFMKDKTIYLLSTITKNDNKEAIHFQYFVDSFKLQAK